MRRIKKGEIPAILKANGKSWTDEYMRHIAASEKPAESLKGRYRHPEIKAAVVAEVFEKCAYCESKVTHVYPGDVEHIVPKAVKPELIFEWSNLTYACSACNGRKSDYHDDAEPLINPLVDDPGRHLVFFGFMCLHQPCDRKGQLTHLKLHLNRPELLERRKERLDKLVPMIDRCLEMSPGPLRDLLRREILAEAGPDREFSAMVAKFLAERLGDLT